MLVNRIDYQFMKILFIYMWIYNEIHSGMKSLIDFNIKKFAWDDLCLYTECTQMI